MTAQTSFLDSTPLYAGIAVPSGAPPSATLQYMNGSHSTIGICESHARLAGSHDSNFGHPFYMEFVVQFRKRCAS